MRAIYYEEYGDASVLQYGEQPKPNVKDHQILVRVHASSVNPVDWKIRSGLLLPVSGLHFPKIPGRDIAGEVVEVGSQVVAFQPGARVYGMTEGIGGANAEYALISEETTVQMPSNLTYAQAAAVPLAALTALQAIRDKGELQQGDRVLVNGAASGVGSFAVQIAKAMGAGEVTGVCGTNHVELVRSLGADHIIDHTKEDFTAAKDRYDLIFDAVAKSSYVQTQGSLRHHGRYVTTVPDLKDIAIGFALSVFSDKKLKMMFTDDKAEDLKLISSWIEAGKVKPVIDREYPLEKAIEAHLYSEQGHAAGKIILIVE